MLEKLFVNDFISQAPPYFFILVFALSAVVYFFASPEKRRTYFLRLIYGAAGFRLLYALYISAGQYFVWTQDEFTKLFLSPEVGGISGYFLPYAGLRFWMGSVILTFILAAAFGALLRILKKYRERFFEEGEPELGVLMMLLVGWPEGVLFMALLAFTVITVSVWRAIVWRSPYTTLGAPFLLAGGLTLFRGAHMIQVLGWTVFRI